MHVKQQYKTIFGTFTTISTEFSVNWPMEISITVILYLLLGGGQ